MKKKTWREREIQADRQTETDRQRQTETDRQRNRVRGESLNSVGLLMLATNVHSLNNIVMFQVSTEETQTYILYRLYQNS